MIPEQMAELTGLNRSVNALPFIDHGDEPYDYWHDTPEPGKSWVCRDYVEMKAERLRESGWDPKLLRVVLCWTEEPDSGYYAVLGVTVGSEIWILDSRADDPYLMQTPSPNGYRWDRIQVAGTVDFEPVA